MKACGLVVEYNPFHNGHIYHLNKAKELTNCDVVIAVMSSNYVQRGEVAFLPKDERVKQALNAGVDLIVELPFLFSVESADLFAYHSLEILQQLKVKEIVFGSESGDTDVFMAKYDTRDFYYR